MLKFAFLISVMMFITGCASNRYSVTFDTVPQGATLICAGQSYGYTPVTRYYSKDASNVNAINVGDCEAVWSSGAKSQYPSDLAVFESGRTNFSLPRPDIPGYSQDAEFALKVKKLRVDQQNLRVNQKNLRVNQQKLRLKQRAVHAEALKRKSIARKRARDAAAKRRVRSVIRKEVRKAYRGKSSHNKNRVECKRLKAAPYKEVKTFLGTRCPSGWRHLR